MSDIPDKIQLELVVVDELGSLERGDHLAVPGKIKKLRYLHHGIYLGTDMTVADFGTDSYNIKSAHVRKIDILKFKGNKRLYKFVYPEGTCNTSKAAAVLAEEVVKTPDLWGPYDLRENNCEHFATKCKTGKPYSIQVENVRKLLKKPKEAAARSARSVCSIV